MDCCFNRITFCAALTQMKCQNCSFKKTKRQLLAGRRKAHERIVNLPQAQYTHIVRKYYGTIKAEEEE